MDPEPYEVSKARIECIGESQWEGFKKMNKKHGSPTFYALLEEMSETHDKKSHDYASDSNPIGNYEFAGQVATMFSHSPRDAGFAGRLAEKIYRLANLESGNKTPKNEGVDDTERDIATIATLWMASRRDRRADSGCHISTPDEIQSQIIGLANNLPLKDLADMADYLVQLVESKYKKIT